jgi:hypothetical protein
MTDSPRFLKLLNMAAGPTRGARSGDPWFWTFVVAFLKAAFMLVCLWLSTRAALKNQYAEATYWLALYLVVSATI